MAESIIHLRVAIDVITPLQDRYRGRLDAFVGGNLMMYYEEGNPRRSVSPDLFVTLGVPSEPPRPTWKVWEEGKLADFVLEVTSKTTRGNDEGPKKRLYQRLEVSEYWQFDPTGDYLDPKLKGQRLRPDGQYAPIALEEFEEGLRGHSAVLGLELRLEDDRLRYFDSEAGAYLLTSAEKSLAIAELDRDRLAAERRVAELERRLADLSPD